MARRVMARRVMARRAATDIDIGHTVRLRYIAIHALMLLLLLQPSGVRAEAALEGVMGEDIARRKMKSKDMVTKDTVGRSGA
jgi:hypothetical protein